MFERFTGEARAVTSLADDGARRLGHDWIGTEHLLVALASTPGLAGEVLAGAGATAEALRRELQRETRDRQHELDADALGGLGIDLADVRRSVDRSFGEGALDDAGRRPRRRRGGWLGKARFTVHAKRALALAVRRAPTLGHGYIGTEHILLGILDEGQGLGAALLGDVGADPAALRQATLDRIRRSA